MQNKHSVFGIISFFMGLLNIIITLIIIVSLKQITSRGVNISIVYFVKYLNLYSNIETYTKAAGLLLGLIGLLHKNHKKSIAIIGLTINLITIIWTIIIVYI